MNNNLRLLFLLTLIAISGFSQKKLINTHSATNEAATKGNLKYPYKFEFKGNPLSRMHSATDPDVVVWDDEVWMYCSQDRAVDSTRHKHHYDAMDGYHAFSSKDMINWTDHGEIFNSFDVPWAWKKGGFLWAPAVARKNGNYYLYYPIKNEEGKWRVGVAVGKTPVGPFKDSGKPLEGLSDIDPKIFIDDDGQSYLYNNSAIVAKLKPNMIEMEEAPRKIDYAPRNVMENDTLKCLEGTYMHKKNGKYYYSYTNWKNKSFQGYYGIGDNPYGPFEWKGAIAPRPQGAQDHHSIIEFKGQWYYFYHISLKNLPQYKESQGRIACYEKLYYNPDGMIQMVKHTRE
jgi:arabinoxylan arabinofuranohydrolase